VSFTSQLSVEDVFAHVGGLRNREVGEFFLQHQASEMSVVVKVIVQIVSLNLHPDLIVFFQV
jgi:hypothetical protein